MVMVVECESCRSRFRVKKSLLVGTHAIRFRCRACGGFIVVRNPDMPKITEIPAAPPAHPWPVEPSIAVKPSPPEKYTDPERPPGTVKTAPPDSYVEPEGPPVAGDPSAPAGEAVSIFDRLEDFVPVVHTAEERFGQDAVGEAGGGKRDATDIRFLAERKRAWAIGVFRLFALLGILLLLASGAYYIGAFNPWSSKAASAQAKPVFDLQNLEAYIPREAVAGNLFVISGTVRNVGNAPSRGIRIQATLFGNDNQVLMRQESLAGNRIEKTALSSLTRAAIEGQLAAVRPGTGTGNQDVPPGSFLPFTVVCFDPPGVVESYEVLATISDR
jgi:hypothetical protein